jgi:broad specificity phosphatase PhoE
MADTVRLVLLRHGEVEERFHRVFGGRLDMGLSELGERQAASLAEYLRGQPFRALYSSPLRRARLTAEPLARGSGLPIQTVEGLAEVDFGAWTGLRWEQVKERFGVSAFDWLHEIAAHRVPEGETCAAFEQRVRDCLAPILTAHAGQMVALACHGGVVRMILSCLLEIPLPMMAGFDIDYASVTVLDYRPGKAEVQLLNYTPWRSLL